MGTEEAASALVRLTGDVRQALLDLNDGFTTSTSYLSKNSRTTWVYLIRDGVLQVREVGKGAFGGSHFDNTYIADGPATHRFLRNNLTQLDTRGVADAAARAARDRKAAAAAAAAAKAAVVAASTSVPVAPVAAAAKAAAGAPAAASAGRDVASLVGDVTGKQVAAVGAVVAGLVTAGAAAPHAKRLWDDKLAPRAARLRHDAAERIRQVTGRSSKLQRRHSPTGSVGRPGNTR